MNDDLSSFRKILPNLCAFADFKVKRKMSPNMGTLLSCIPWDLIYTEAKYSISMQ